MRTALLTIGVVIVVAVLTALAVIYTGIPDVAATSKHQSLVHWALTTTREHSVERRAESIQAPPLDRQERVENGFRGYREMCAICHTPPGDQASPLAEGLNPQPPDLSKVAEQQSAAELFWVIKNGIRMTGMPAWGMTHSEDEIWDLVAFIKALPQINPSDYQAMARRLPAGHGHTDEAHQGMPMPEPNTGQGHSDDGHGH